MVLAFWMDDFSDGIKPPDEAERMRRANARGGRRTGAHYSVRERGVWGSAGGKASSGKMTPEQLHERAVKAARARWGNGEEAKPVLTQAVLDEFREQLLRDHRGD